MGLFDVLNSGEQQPRPATDEEYQANVSSWRKEFQDIENNPEAIATLFKISNSLANNQAQGQGFLQNVSNSIMDGAGFYSNLQAQKKKEALLEQERARQQVLQGREDIEFENSLGDRRNRIERQKRIDALDEKNINSQIDSRNRTKKDSRVSPFKHLEDVRIKYSDFSGELSDSTNQNYVDREAIYRSEIDNGTREFGQFTESDIDLILQYAADPSIVNKNIPLVFGYLGKEAIAEARRRVAAGLDPVVETEGGEKKDKEKKITRRGRRDTPRYK